MNPFKFFFAALVLTSVLSACSDSQKEYPPYRVEELNKQMQADLEAEVLEKMKLEAIDWMIADSEERQLCCVGCGPVEDRNYCEITLHEGKIYFLEDSTVLDSIANQVFNFLTANHDLTEKETQSNIQNPNYKYYNFPFFSILTEDEINKNIKREKNYMKNAIAVEHHDLAEFYKRSIREWKQKLQLLIVLRITELKEIHPLAQVRIESKQDSSGFSPVAFETLKAYLKARNYVIKIYLNCSYLDLYYRSERLSEPLAQKQMKAIETLVPIRLLDEPFMNLTNLYFPSKLEEISVALPN